MNIDEIKSCLKARGVTILNSSGNTFSFQMPKSQQTYRLELRGDDIHFSPVPPKNLSDKVYFTSKDTAITAMQNLNIQNVLSLPLDNKGLYISNPLSTQGDVEIVLFSRNDPNKAKIIIPMKYFQEMLPKPKSLAASPPPAPKAGGSKPTPPSKSSQSLERLHVFDFDGTLATCKVNHVMGWKLKKQTKEFADLAGSSSDNTSKKIKQMLNHSGMAAKPTEVMGKLREVAQSETEDFAIATYNCCPDVIAYMISEAMTGKGSNFKREELANNTRTIGTIQPSSETKEVEKTPVEIKAYGYKIPGTNIRFRVIAPKVTPEMVKAYRKSEGREGFAGYNNLINLHKKQLGYPKTKMVEFAAETSTCPVSFYDDSIINTQKVAQSQLLQSRSVEVFHCDNGKLPEPAASAPSRKGGGGGSKKHEPHPAALTDEEIIKWLSEKISSHRWRNEGQHYILNSGKPRNFRLDFFERLKEIFLESQPEYWEQINDQGYTELHIPKTELQKIAETIRNDLSEMKQAESARQKRVAAQKGSKTQEALPSSALKTTSTTQVKLPERLENLITYLSIAINSNRDEDQSQEEGAFFDKTSSWVHYQDKPNVELLTMKEDKIIHCNLTFPNITDAKKFQETCLACKNSLENQALFKEAKIVEVPGGFKVQIHVDQSLLEETSNESKKGDSNHSPRPGGSGGSRV